MQLDQVISNPDLEGDYSPIYTTEKKNGSVPVKKLVRTRYFFRVNLPYYVFMKWVRTRFSGFYGPKPKKKKKKKKNESGSLLLFESGVSTLLRSVPSSLREPAVVYGGFAHVYYSLFSHKPNLIVTPVNG